MLSITGAILTFESDQVKVPTLLPKVASKRPCFYTETRYNSALDLEEGDLGFLEEDNDLSTDELFAPIRNASDVFRIK